MFDAFSIVDYLPICHDLFAMLWEDPGIKETFKRRSEIQVIDSIGYYLDNLDRICRPEYLPSNQDILHARKTTQSIVECQIQIDNVEFHFTDVGGQVRWCADTYNLSSYDQLMSYLLANIYDLLDSREPSGENGMASFPRK